MVQARPVLKHRPASTAASPAGLAPSTSSRISDGRSDTATLASAVSPRAPLPPFFQSFMALCRRRMPAPRAPFPSARASETARHLGYGIIQAMGVCASGADLSSLGTRVCASSAVLPSQAPRSTKIITPVPFSANVSLSFTSRPCGCGRFEVLEGQH